MSISVEKYDCYKHILLSKETHSSVDFSNDCFFKYSQAAYKSDVNLFVCPAGEKIKQNPTIRKRRERLTNFLKGATLSGDTIKKDTLIKGKICHFDVVPNTKVAEIVHMFHDEVGHPGAHKTFNAIKELYIGVTFEAVVDYMNRCGICLSRKPINLPPVHSTPIKVYIPFERVGLDFTLFQHPVDTTKRRWILNVVDYFTRFGFSFSLRNSEDIPTSQETIQVLSNLFHRIGIVPKSIQSDNGSQFVSVPYVSFMARLGIKIIHGVPGNKETGGRFERLHQTQKSRLRATILEKNISDLDNLQPLLDEVMFHYNNAPHEALCCKGENLSPVRVLYAGGQQTFGSTQSDGARPVIHGPDDLSVPDFTEDLYLQTLAEDSATRSSALGGVRKAEAKTAKPKTKKGISFPGIVVGDCGRIRIPRGDRVKGGLVNALGMVSKRDGNFLQISLLNEDFKKMGKQLRNRVHVTDFVKIKSPGKISETTPSVPPMTVSLRQYARNETSNTCRCTIASKHSQGQVCNTTNCSCKRLGVPCSSKCRCSLKQLSCNNSDFSTSTTVTDGSKQQESAPTYEDTLPDISTPSVLAFKQSNLNCYAAVVLSILQYIPQFFELLQSCPEVQVGDGDVRPVVIPAFLNLIKQTAQYNLEEDCSKKTVLSSQVDVGYAQLFNAMEWDGCGRPGTGQTNDSSEFYLVLLDKILQEVEIWHSTKLDSFKKIFISCLNSGTTTDNLLIINVYKGKRKFPFLNRLLRSSLMRMETDGVTSVDQFFVSVGDVVAIHVADKMLHTDKESYLSVPPKLDMRQYVHAAGSFDKEYQYMLKAVITYQAEHYRAWVRTSDWTLHDGEIVRESWPGEATREIKLHGYAFFYVKISEETSSPKVDITLSDDSPDNTGDDTIPYGHDHDDEDQKEAEKKHILISDNEEMEDTIAYSDNQDDQRGSDKRKSQSTDKLVSGHRDKLPIRPSKLSLAKQKRSHNAFQLSDDPDLEPTEKCKKNKSDKKRPQRNLQRANYDIDTPFQEILKDFQQKEDDEDAEEEMREKDEEGLTSEDKKLLGPLLSSISVQPGNVQWSDIIGLEDVKEKLKQSIIFPRLRPELYTEFGIKPAKGFLLFGPPGTGKTLIVKALASAAEMTMFSVKPSDIMNKYIGNSARNVKLLFRLARNRSPVIIFIDEIEALTISREEHGSDEKKAMVTQLLQEMDGFMTDPSQVFVVGATNYPWQIDSAIRRRLPIQLFVPLPDDEAREALLRRDLPSSIDFGKVISKTKGLSSSEITELCRETRRAKLGQALKGRSLDEIKSMAVPSRSSLTTQDVLDALGTISRALNPNLATKYKNFNKK